MIKGQEVLLDGGTLEEHGITDGSTVNIIIEPEKEIHVTVVFGPRRFSYRVTSSMSVRQLKQRLIDDEQVALVRSDFDLTLNGSVMEPFLALHYFTPESPLVVFIRLAFLRLNIEQVGSNIHWTRKMPRAATVEELKKIIAREICGNPQAEISVYFEGREKLENDQVLGDVVEDPFDHIFFIENKCYEKFKEIFYKGKCEGFIGVESTDTREDWKLRAQDQMGVPVGQIHVKNKMPHKWNRFQGYVIMVEEGEKASKHTRLDPLS